MSEGAQEAPRASRLAWLSGAILLLALIVVATHLSEEKRLAELLTRARPAWLIAAALFQLGTYVCAAAVWYCALDGSSPRPALLQLVPLGVAKLFTDQAVPSAGLSGTLLVVRALTRRGVERARAVAAMLVGLVAFYGAYALVVTLAVGWLAALGEVGPAGVALAAVLGFVAGVGPVLLLAGRARLLAHVPRVLHRVPLVRGLLATLSELPAGRLWSPRVAAATIALQLAVFALDAATLGVMLLAVGAPAPAAIVFVSFVSASVVATLAWVPGGVGAFESVCVVLLRSHGVPLEAALAATLLLRGFTFWLPMAPGLWLARRELRSAAGAG